MYRLLVILSLMLSVFIFTPSTQVQAGALFCVHETCQMSEGNCNDNVLCSVNQIESEDPCSWCGTFCADECPSEEPAVIIPTMGQWGIIFASILLGAIGIVAIIRERNMGRYMDE